MRLWLALIAAGVPVVAAQAQTCTDYSLPTRFVQRTLEDPEVYYRSVDLVGPYLYAAGSAAASKPYFSIADITDPLQPVLVGKVSSVDGSEYANTVRVAGTHAYLAGSEFQVIDIGDPANPFLEVSIPLSLLCTDLCLDGDVAYVTVYESNLLSIDITAPGAPSLLDSLDLGARVQSVFVDRPYAYVATPSEVFVVDVADPNHLAIVSSVAAPAVDVAVAYGYLYVGSTSGIVVVDVSKPEVPAIVTYAFRYAAEQVLVHGNYLIANDIGHVVVHDLSSPAAPTPILRSDICATRSFRHTLAAAGSYIFTAADLGDGVEVGLLSPNAPADGYLDGVTGWHSTFALRIRDDIAYVGSHNTSGPDYDAFRLFDVTSPEAIQPLGVSNVAGVVNAVDGDGSTAYAGLDNQYLVAIDISDVYDPVPLDTLAVGYRLVDVVVDGPWLYALDSGMGLRAYDVSDPSAMTQASYTSFAASGRMGEMAIDGDHAYVAWVDDAGPSGLEIVDLSTPDQPVRLTTVELPSGGRRVAVGGGFAYVTYLQGAHLAVVDISNPTSPILVGDTGLPGKSGYRHDIALDGSYLYAGSDQTGVCVVDVGDPSHPRAVGSMYPPTFGVLELPWSGLVATANGAVFTSSLVGQGKVVSLRGQCDVASAVETLPGRYRLSLRAHPNPFNPATVISFELAARARVRLDVYDVSGRRVRTLLDRVMESGPGRVAWDGRDQKGSRVASGVYFARLSSRLGGESIKLTLLK